MHAAVNTERENDCESCSAQWFHGPKRCHENEIEVLSSLPAKGVPLKADQTLCNVRENNMRVIAPSNG